MAIESLKRPHKHTPHTCRIQDQSSCLMTAHTTAKEVETGTDTIEDKGQSPRRGMAMRRRESWGVAKSIRADRAMAVA